MRRTLMLGALALALAATTFGCGKKEEAGGAAVGGEAKTITVEKETKTFEDNYGTITVEVPKGWQEQTLGEKSYIRSAPGGGFNPSRFWVSSTCQGACSSIPKNLEARAKQQIEAFGATYSDYEVKKDQPLDGGGRVIHITMKSGGKPAHFYEKYLYQDGWDGAAMCQLTLVGDEAAALDTFVAMCDAMKVEPKKP